MEPPLTFEDALGSDEPTVASIPPDLPLPPPVTLEEPEGATIPQLVLVQPGSFTVSTMAVTGALFLLLFAFLAFLAADSRVVAGLFRGRVAGAKGVAAE